MESSSSSTLLTTAEEVEESLEELLIFPTQKGLLHSMKMMRTYFEKEDDTMKKQISTGTGTGTSTSTHALYQSMIEDQQTILDIGISGIDNNRDSSKKESC